jgi:hypothetical protein
MGTVLDETRRQYTVYRPKRNPWDSPIFGTDADGKPLYKVPEIEGLAEATRPVCAEMPFARLDPGWSWSEIFACGILIFAALKFTLDAVVFWLDRVKIP